MQAKAPAVRRGLFYCASKIKTSHGPEKQPGGHKEQGRAALALSRRPYADQLFHVRKHSFIGYRYHQPAAAVERAGRVVQLPHRRRAEGKQRLCRHGFPLADAHKAGERAGRRIQGTQCAASLFIFYIPARRHTAAAVFDARHRAVARFQPAAQCFPQGIVHKLCDIAGCGLAVLRPKRVPCHANILLLQSVYPV